MKYKAQDIKYKILNTKYKRHAVISCTAPRVLGAVSSSEIAPDYITRWADV